jgi:hypothetical protein
MTDKRLAARWLGVALLAAGVVITDAGCGLLPERVSPDDPRLRPMFDAMAIVDRQAMGFTPVARESDIRIEWVSKYGRLLFGQRNYDVMLHVGGRTSKTIAFKRNGKGYEWVGEQEMFEGPRTYESGDGKEKNTSPLPTTGCRSRGFRSTQSLSTTRAMSANSSGRSSCRSKWFVRGSRNGVTELKD